MSSAPTTLDACCERLARPYQQAGSGVVVAVSARGHEHVRAFGRIDRSRPAPPSATTLFEIGSITKVFTAILLAAFVRDRRLDLDAPVAEMDDELAGMPAWITPRALATHTSGLPRVPFSRRELLRLDPTDPYAAFGPGELIAWLRRYRPSRPPNRQKPRYSNLGVGLLGFVLARLAGDTFERVLRREVLDPLMLADTTIAMDAAHRERLATPHRGPNKATVAWSFDALAGAGALRSTARDLLTFGRAAVAAGRSADPLGGAIATTLEVQIASTGSSPTGQCLGWVRRQTPRDHHPCFFHDGGTLGSSSALFVLPEADVVVAVLANCGLGLWRMLRLEWARPDRVIDDLVRSL